MSTKLVEDGFPVYDVSPVLTDRQRKHTMHKDKSDYTDAKGVAEVTLRKQRRLPQLIITKESRLAKIMGALIKDREFLVHDQTRIKNHLHRDLHEFFGNDYHFNKYAKFLFREVILDEYVKKLQKIDTYESHRVIRKIYDLRYINQQIEEMNKELKDMTKETKSVQKLMEIHGCENLTACKIVSEIQDIKKFPTKAKLARYAGLAPRLHTSAGRGKRYTDRGGNRSLNRAIHTIALSQIGNSDIPVGIDYYHKKQKEGKSNLHALRCLKRQLVNKIYYKLSCLI